MPYEIRFENLPIGVAANDARGGGTVNIITQKFSSTEDGDEFVKHLEGFPTQIVGMLPSDTPIRVSAIDHILLIVRPDHSGTVYLNELTMLPQVKPKGKFEPGQVVYGDDIAEVYRLAFGGVSIPKDAGYLFLFSAQWRKGLQYDFSPLDSRNGDREYDVEVLLGQRWAYLAFQDRFKITESEWAQLLAKSWFPFTLLKHSTIKQMLVHVRAGWEVDDLLEAIADDVKGRADDMRNRWRASAVFASHCVVLENALDKYLEGDYISATHILYPRIEGVMRSHHLSVRPAIDQKQATLIASAIGNGTGFMLLPEKFRNYLTDVYFANFNPASPCEVSRNTVSHGVAPAEMMDLKAASIGLLTLDQLSYYFGA